MKRNYLFLVAMLFLLCMAVFTFSTHALEKRPKEPSYKTRTVERSLPHLLP